MHKELFVGQLPVVEFNFYNHKGVASTVTDPKIKVDNVPLDVQITQLEAGELEAALPYETYSHLEKTIRVEWEFKYGGNTYKRDQYYDIVTPLAEWDDFAGMFKENQLGYGDFLKVEKLVRQIINAYCAQTFGKYAGSIPVEGNAQDAIVLPRHILSVANVSWALSGQRSGPVIDTNNPYQWVSDADFGHSFDVNGPLYTWEIAAEGWVVRRSSFSRERDPAYADTHFFKRNRFYVVTGVWGYDYPPAPVLEAAKLLVEDYVCPDINYRNRYMDSIKFDNHRLGYHEKAWQGTGNVMADQLLQDYRVVPTAAVI